MSNQESHQLSNAARRLLGPIRILQIAAAIYVLRAGVSLLVPPMQGLSELLSGLEELEALADWLSTLANASSQAIRAEAVVASALVLVGLWRTAGVRSGRIRVPVYWMAAACFVLVVFVGAVAVGDRVSKALTGLSPIDAEMFIRSVESWAFPPIAVASVIACALIALRINGILGDRIASNTRIKLLARTEIILTVVFALLFAFARWLFPLRYGWPIDSPMFDTLSAIRVFGGAWAWLAWQIWFFVETTLTGRRLRRLVTGSFCSKCGYYLGARIAEGCPECGWGRGPARGVP